MIKFALIFMLGVLGYGSFGQTQYNTSWIKTYGGSHEEFPVSFIEVPGNGYLVYGISESSDGDVSQNYGESDAWVIKLDNEGELEWEKNYGGSSFDWFNSAKPTTDGGYILAGYTESNDHDVTENFGRRDIWVVKITATGDIQWQKSVGSQYDDEAFDVAVDNDGYIVVGYDLNSNLFKFNNSGGLLWTRNFGVPDKLEQHYKSIVANGDGTFMIAGFYGTNYNEYYGILSKIDTDGNQNWYKTYNEYRLMEDPKLLKDINGNYVVAAKSYNYKCWLLKTNPSGDRIWEHELGSAFSQVSNVVGTNDGYLISGFGFTNYEMGIYNMIVSPAGDSLVDFFALNLEYSVNSGSTLQYDENSFITVCDLYTNWNEVTEYGVVKTCVGNPLSVTLSDSTYCPPALVWGNEGFENYRWTKGAYIDSVFYGDTRVIEVSEGGQYNLTAWNGHGCPSYSSINVPDPLFTLQRKDLCFVTVDETAGVNKLIFSEINPQSVVDSIYIYRTNENNEHVMIGRMNIDANEFMDITSNPSQQSYIYSVSNLDTCGLEVGGVQHMTLLLQSSLGANNEVNLSWNQYAGIDYDYVEIYRSVNSSGVWEDYVKIAQLPAAILSYTDVNPPTGNKKYQLRITPPEGCAGSMQLISNTEFTNSCSTLSLAVTKTPSHCGLDDGTVMVVATGGTEPYNYVWQGYLQGNALIGLPEGIYHLKVTDNEGCTIENLVTIEQAQPSAWAEAFPDVAGTTVCEGKITIHLQDAYPPFTCYLNGSQVAVVNDTIYNVCSGTYALTIHSAECTMEINTEVPNGLTDGVATNYYRLYPVPAKEKIYLELSEDGAIGAVATVITLQGTVLSEVSLTGKKTIIDTAGLHAGLYLLKVCIEGNCFVNRFVKLN